MEELPVQKKEGAAEAPEIRPVTEADFDQFATIVEEINESPLGEEATKRLREDFAKGRFTGFQLLEKGELAAIAVVVDSYSAVHARKVLQLDEIYVREAFRSKGLGKTLFDNVVEYAKQQGYMRLEWRVEKGNAAAQALYAQYATNTDSTYYLMEL